MQKTFTIQNMETYFNNYIPCNEHRKEPVTNFCTEGRCLKFLCPECVESHSNVYANHTIESIKTCIKKTSERLRETITQLQAETGRNSFLRADNTQEYTKQLIRELQEVKEGLIQEIKAYFKEKEYDIRKQTSKYTETQKKLETLRKDLVQATAELRMLEKNLFVPQETLKAIKKANKISYAGMVSHFHERIDDVEKEMNFSLRLEMNNDKRQALKASLNQLIGIKNKNYHKDSQGGKKYANNADKMQKNGPAKAFPLYENKSMKNSYPTNSPILSADRLLQQNSFRIQTKNFFQTQPFLHFFEVTNSTLHIIKISNIKHNEPLKWQVVPLDIQFKIPSFHRTIATEGGEIFVIGGTNPETLKRSRDIYRCDYAAATLTKVSELIIPRSSHSILCHEGVIYISGGMTNNDQTLKKCEVFNPRTDEVKAIASCKYQTTNSCLSSIGKDHLLKFGGVHANGENNNTLEVYSIKANLWAEVDPTIEHQGEFGLLSCSGWAPLNQSQIFVFGGYNEEIESENSRMSFVIQHSSKEENEFVIKYVNNKNPPFAQGFWNQQGIVHNSLIYCLQNVDGEQENDCLEDRKSVLIFNGKTWSTCLQNQR